MTSKIERLTPEQEALLPEYREKWRKIALSKEPIDRQQATEAIKAAYAAIGKPEPDVVLFCDSPQAVPKTLLSILKRQLGRELEWLAQSYSKEQQAEQLRQNLGSSSARQFEEQLHYYLRSQLEAQLDWRVITTLDGRLWESYDLQLWEQLQLNQQLQEYWSDCFSINLWIHDASWFDFAISALNCVHTQEKWLAFKSLVEHCGWILPYDKICIACDRPQHLCFDTENRLHAEGEPAIQFADGFSIYAYQGVRLPEQYGRLHPHQWRSHWLLQEPNAELRRVLIQGIGYGRICQELEAIALDSWQEYSLLEIAADLDEEPILLLKMTCPSTGLIHVSRVPPDVESAKEAIRWVNWDIDPEEFAIQT